MQLVRIALAVPLFQFFDYLLAQEQTPALGCRVLVPFGKQSKVGIVVGFPTQTEVPTEQLKGSPRSSIDNRSFPPHFGTYCIGRQIITERRSVMYYFKRCPLNCAKAKVRSKKAKHCLN